VHNGVHDAHGGAHGDIHMMGQVLLISYGNDAHGDNHNGDHGMGGSHKSEMAQLQQMVQH